MDIEETDNTKSTKVQKHDISSRFMQKKIKKELQEHCRLEMLSKRGKETTLHFRYFQEAHNSKVKQTVDASLNEESEPKTQDEITQERLKRFKTMSVGTTITDKEISHHFKNRLATMKN